MPKKGTKLSEETKNKIGLANSISQKGQKKTEETKKKIKKSLKGKAPLCAGWNKNKKFPERSGENHWNYKGGISQKRRKLKERFLFLKKHNFTCQYCGRKAPEVQFHIDHFYPKSKGGISKEENYVLACDECNIGKGDLIILQR
jgi:5-methylcytosine-specific restriction endonuclease McrA